MKNINLEANIDCEITLLHVGQESEFLIKLYALNNRYEEYLNNQYVKSIKCPRSDMVLILMESRIAELESQGYEYVNPEYSPQLKSTATSWDAAKAFVAMINEQKHELGEVLATQLDSVVTHTKGISSYEEDARRKLRDRFTYGCNFEINEFILGVQHEDKLFVWLSDSDLVSLCDGTKYACKDSKISELDIDYRKMNCIHTGELRKLFYRPEAQQLSYLNISCGFDSLMQLFNILEKSNALHVPLTLRLTKEIEAPPPKSLKSSIIGHINLHALMCDIEDFRLFSEDLGEIRSLCLWGDFDVYMQVLEKYSFKKLIHLNIGVFTEGEKLEQFFLSDLIPQLRSLVLGRVRELDDHFPYAALLKMADKWQHIERIYIDGHYVHEDNEKLFANYPQVIFVSFDHRESMGNDLATFGYCTGME